MYIHHIHTYLYMVINKTLWYTRGKIPYLLIFSPINYTDLFVKVYSVCNWMDN